MRKSAPTVRSRLLILRRNQGLKASYFEDTRTGVLRSGGSAESNAARTVRRCTPCRVANARIDKPSTLASLRIAAKTSTRAFILALR